MQQNWIHCFFLVLAFLITWAAWVMFGVFATVRLVIIDFCQNNDDALAGRPGTQQFISCPDLSAAQASLNEVFQSMDLAIITANGAIQSVLQPHA
jgi:hypothetical protein